MSVPSIVVIAVVAAMNLAIAAADLVPADFVLTNSAAVGVPRRWLPVLALLKGAGGIGLIVGVVWSTPVGVAAGSGLTLFYLGAVTVHLRAGVLHNVAFPATFLVMAVAGLVAMGTG